MGYQQAVLLIVVSSLVASTLAIAGQYVPRSYYVIDKFGHQSDLVYLRTRRALDLHPFVMRSKRGGGAYSSSSASSSSSAGSGAPIYFGDDLPNRAYSNVESNASGNGGYGGGGSRSFASSSSSSSAGTGSGGGGGGGHPGGSYGNNHYNNDGPQLFSRFGEAEGTGVKVGASAAGPKAAFSSSSSSIDSNGKIKYSIQSGKI